MAKRKTAGQLSIEASRDLTRYDPLEIGHALTDDVMEQLKVCAERHEKIFDEEEFCLILIIAGDPLIAGVRRHKYAAFLYLPQPRPQQSVYLYNKRTKTIRRLWSLPKAEVMAVISEMKGVAHQWKKTKRWCDAFFSGKFFEYIRHEHNIKILSESEFLNANREELIKSGCKQVDSTFSEPFDFSKVSINKIVDTKTAIA